MQGPAQSSDNPPQTSPAGSSPSDTGPSSPRSSSPIRPGVPPSIKKEKGRVRFNSFTEGKGNIDPPAKTNVPELESPIRRPRPSIVRSSSYNGILDADNEDDKAQSAAAAHQRAKEAQAVATLLLSSASGRSSQVASRRSSQISEVDTVLSDSERFLSSRHVSPENAMERGDFADKQAGEPRSDPEALKLVRAHTERARNRNPKLNSEPSHQTFHRSGYSTPDSSTAEDSMRGGVLSHLLKLYKQDNNQNQYHHARHHSSGFSTPVSSGTVTPTRRKWYEEREKLRSTETLSSLAAASAILANPNETPRQRPAYKRSSSSRTLMEKLGGRSRQDDEYKITAKISNILTRQKFILELCRALMLYGAPTHRLEEYLSKIAKMMGIDCQFLYIPGCMILSFDDKSTHTTEVKIIRTIQGVNLGKLKDVHSAYKEVYHSVLSVEEGLDRVTEIMEAKDRYPIWLQVLFYGFASASVGPFGFNGRLIDMPVAFCLGCILGFMKLVVAPWSNSYENLWEVFSAVLLSCLSRWLGSIRGGELFCFSALVQSSIAMILPGYLVLSAALELQSGAIVAGSIRMVYSVIYSLFLGFGITIGITFYGIIDKEATSSTTCRNPLDPPEYTFIFAPVFAACLALINHAKLRQMPVMLTIATAGYLVNYYSSKHYPDYAQLTNTLGALTVGVLANLYSRFRHGVAAAAMLPAIFVLVPSGIAASGSLLSGLKTANSLTNSTVPVDSSGTSTSLSKSSSSSDLVYSVAASMIEIAIGITVGLFLATFIVYPRGKQRSGLFTL